MKKYKNNKGFSLVEVLLAVVLLALVATPVIQLFLSSMKTNKRSREILCANEIAQESMEYIESCDFENDLYPVFTADGDAVRFPGLSYSASNWSTLQAAYNSAMVGFHSFDDFVSKARASVVPKGTAQTNYVEWTEGDVNCFGVVFFNLRTKYDKNDEDYYDEIVVFKENKENSSDEYFIYDVTLTVYSVENKTNDDGSVSVSRFRDKMCSMNGSIVNKR